MTYNNNNMNFIIEEMDLIKLSRAELLERCEKQGFTKCKSKNKNELIALLEKKVAPKKVAAIELII